MKKTQKNVLKAALVIALFCPTAFADGDMGGGGLVLDCNNPRTAEEVQQCGEGDMGGGGRTSSTSTTYDSVYFFLNSLIREIL